jgi:hypothetical protein
VDWSFLGGGVLALAYRPLAIRTLTQIRDGDAAHGRDRPDIDKFLSSRDGRSFLRYMQLVGVFLVVLATLFAVAKP